MQRRSGNRAIVDPAAWESTEVGSSEANAMHGLGGSRKMAVSSIRTGLFKKNAKEIANKFNSDCSAFERNTVFKDANECMPLEAPFTFEGNPCLEYCDYGKANKKVWTKDILAVVHNAVRSELYDLTIILQSAQKLGVQLRVGDFSKIRKWWHVCSGVVLDFFDVEMKHLLPWITNATTTAKSLDNSVTEFVNDMPNRQKELRDLVISISKAFGTLCDPAAVNRAKTKQETSDAKKAMLVINSLDALITQTCGYMMDQEQKLPTVLTSVYKSEKKDRDAILIKVITSFAKNARKSDTILVLLTRWMSDSKTSKAFTKTLLEIHECNYSSLQTHFEVNHAGFVHQFQVKAEI